MSFANGLKTIVVATDLAGRSEAALEYARKLAAGYGARIVLAPVSYTHLDVYKRQVLQRGLPAVMRSALTGNLRT